MLKAGAILINGRGFLSREMVNRLKGERWVALKKNMAVYAEAVRRAKMEGKVWYKHPNKKRKIARVPERGGWGRAGDPRERYRLRAAW
jgi:hypothetical protein